jgi:CRISPR-associated protein Cas1
MLSLPDFREKQILYVYAQWGARTRLRLENSNVVYEKDGKVLNRLPACRIFAIFVIGSLSLTTQLIKELSGWGISIHLMKSNCEVYGSIGGQAEGNYLLRQMQYLKCNYDELKLAKWIVEEKIVSQWIELKRLRIGDLKPMWLLVRSLQTKLEKVESYDELLGVEGSYTSQYFPVIFEDLEWRRRAPRTKEDIQNLLLDMGYSYLFHFMEGMLRIFGFDTYKGFYHKLFYGRKSLACDMVEPFRVLIDHRLRVAWNLGQINKKDFKYQNHHYFLPYDNSQKYSQLFLEDIMEHKEEMYLFVREFYRVMLSDSPKSLPSRYKDSDWKKI